MGFVKETNSKDYIGWISLKKRKNNPRINQIFSNEDRPDLIIEQSQISERPYVLQVFELKRLAYEDDNKLPDDADYRISDVFYFETLDDVAIFLKKYNKQIEEVRWMSEIPSV